MEEQLKEHSNQNYKYNNWFYEKKIPEKVCDLIVEEFKKEEFYYGTVGDSRREDFDARFVESIAIPLGHWCLGLPLYYGLDANIENFKYNVTNLAFTEFFTYKEGMFYRPHIDVSNCIDHPTHKRKLTVIIQLSDPNDYGGGDLIWYDSQLNPRIMPKEKGTVIVFNSSNTHEITKITRGVRHSLCGWMMGPPFA